MKKRASGILKEIIAALQSMAKAKKTFQALKNKTNAIKARIVIFSLLNNKKSFLINSISQKFQGLVGLHEKQHCDDVLLQDQEDKTIVLYSMNNAICNEAVETGLIDTNTNISTSVAEHDHHQCDDNHDGENNTHDDQVLAYYYNKDVEKYPDLTHTLFVEDDDDDDLAVARGGSVIDMVKNSKEEAGEEFRLEDEIDQVADLFIRKFHRQIRYQKQQSFKRYKEMLQRSA